MKVLHHEKEVEMRHTSHIQNIIARIFHLVSHLFTEYFVLVKTSLHSSE